MRTIADLKRQATNYTWEMVWNSWFGGPLQPVHKFYGLKREVGKVQSNSLAFNSPNGLSWLDWPKSSETLIEEMPGPSNKGCYYLKICPKDEKDCKLTYILRPKTN